MLLWIFHFVSPEYIVQAGFILRLGFILLTMEIKLTVQLYLAQPDVIFLWFVSLQFAKYSSNIKYIISSLSILSVWQYMCLFVVNVLFSVKVKHFKNWFRRSLWLSLNRELCARTQNRFGHISAYIVFSEKIKMTSWNV